MRRDALLEATLHAIPFRAGDDAQQKIGRDDPLRGLVVGIDDEGDALVQEALLSGLLVARELIRCQHQKAQIELCVMLPHMLLGGEHFLFAEPS